MRMVKGSLMLGLVACAVLSCSPLDMSRQIDSPDLSGEGDRLASLQGEEQTSTGSGQPGSAAGSPGDSSQPEASSDSPESPPHAEKIVVVKRERIMRLLKEGDVLREYKISLGKNPNGHKTRQGDMKTPEGCYYIEGRNPHSSYHLALRISYPEPPDVENARAQGVKPGGNIMIHGLPNGITNKYRMEKDWTNGCIAVSNEEIEEIWNLVPNGTPIEIQP